MEIKIIVPEQTKNIEIRDIKIILGQRKAIVETWKDGIRNRDEVDLQLLIDKATSSQLTVIKGFLKKIVAISLGVDTSKIPDNIFSNN